MITALRRGNAMITAIGPARRPRRTARRTGVLARPCCAGCKNRDVASATALEKVPSHGSLTRPNLVSVGTIVWLSSELMFFASLFAMYFTVRAAHAEWPQPPTELNLP